MEIEVGTRVKANHPITVLNPEETFLVKYMKFEQGRNVCFVRGDLTCWFRADQVKIV